MSPSYDQPPKLFVNLCVELIIYQSIKIKSDKGG